MALTKEDLQALSDMIDTKLDTKLEPIKTDIQDMKTDMQDMKTDMQNMKTDMQNMKTDMQNLKTQITGIELHLENTTDKAISFIAEGHLDLDRKLNQALESAQEREALLVRVSYLESNVRKLNSKYADIT